jgi:hypothetical protein
MAKQKIDITWIFECVRRRKPNLFPKSILTQKILLSNNPQDLGAYFINANLNTLIVEIIKNDLISLLPKRLLTKGLMLKEIDQNNRTVLMEFAKHGLLYLAPKEAITAKTITKKDSFGESVIYHACTTGEVALIPTELITKGAVTDKNRRGRNCLHQASRHGNLHLLPPKTITPATMLGKDPQRLDPIEEYYTYCIGKDKNPDNILKMLNQYKDKELHYIEKKDLAINCLATKILRQRRAKEFAKCLNKKSKTLKLEK